MPEDFKRYDHMVLCLARAANAASGEEHHDFAGYDKSHSETVRYSISV